MLGSIQEMISYQEMIGYTIQKLFSSIRAIHLQDCLGLQLFLFSHK